MTENLYARVQGRPCLVAELSGNHQGSLQKALSLLELAANSGADVVKIQTYTADSLTLDCTLPEFQIQGGLWGGQSLYQLYEQAKTPPQWLPDLFSFAREKKIFLFSSPFAPKDVEALEKVGCPAYKIASFELNYQDLIVQCAQTGKALVMSTGLATLPEVARAVECARKNGCRDLTLLYCVSQYPADPRNFNLRTIPFFKETFGCRAGLSSHALNLSLDIAATALGADLIEKHFTDDRKRQSVDGAFSMQPAEWQQLRTETALCAQALGSFGVRLRDYDKSARPGRRSCYLVRPLKCGQQLTKDDIAVVRPGKGLDPFALEPLLGKRALRDLSAPQPLAAADFS